MTRARELQNLFFDYQRQYGLDIKIARIFNTYGPNMDPNDGRVVSNFIMQALKNEDVTIYGDGSQSRSFCFVDDLIQGLVALMNSSEKVSGPINIGNPKEFTMLELAQLVLELTDSKSKIVFRELPEDDPKQRKPDITLANSLLAWNPTVDLKVGLQSTIEYFQGQHLRNA